MKKKISIVTCGKKGKSIVDVCEEYGDLCCFIDNDITKHGDTINGKKVLSFKHGAERYKRGEIDFFVMPVHLPKVTKEEMTKHLIALGVSEDDITIIYRDNGNNISIRKNIDTYSLEYLQIIVTENCNLKCKGCSHFSPLVEEKSVYNIEEFKKDIAKLTEYIHSIDVIRVMGGEPLVNEDISEYLYAIRGSYPYNEIYLATNGLLLNRMGEKVIQAIRDNDVCVDLTVYPVMIDNLDQVLNFLNLNDIRFRIVHYAFSFARVLDLKRRSLNFVNGEKDKLRCMCNTLWMSKISVCPEVMFIDRINQHFNLHLPKDGIIDLRMETMTSQYLVDRLLKRIPLCEYCNICRVNRFDSDTWKAYAIGEERRLDDYAYTY